MKMNCREHTERQRQEASTLENKLEEVSDEIKRQKDDNTSLESKITSLDILLKVILAPHSLPLQQSSVRAFWITESQNNSLRAI